MLILQNIQGGYTAGNAILQGIDLTIHKGEALGIIGLNGSGKSTLGKAIMNMLPYRSGEFVYKGEVITQLKTHELSQKGLSIFMQGGTVFDELSVWDNLLFATDNKISEITLIQEYFSLLNTSKQKLRYLKADRLSGGERHQLALAMCLLRKPSILILDEPSAGLSPIAARSLFKVLESLKKKHELTILLIEQNIILANNFCDRICLMERGRMRSEFKEKDIKRIEDALFEV